MAADEGCTVAEGENGTIFLLQIIPFPGEGAGEKIEGATAVRLVAPSN